MYNLDINFLKDRGLDESSKKTIKKRRADQPIETKIPMIAGIAAMLILPSLGLLYLWLLNNDKAQLQAEIDQMKQEITQLQGQNQTVQQLENQLKQLNDETNALVSVFNQIKPTSVIFQDIRDRIPQDVGLNSIEQSQTTPPPNTTEKAKAQLVINGIARSHNDVSDFLLLLQDSEFLNPEKTRIESAELINFPIQQASAEQLENFEQRIREGQIGNVPENFSEGLRDSTNNQTIQDVVQFPQVVKYSIRTELNDKPASELLDELKNKGSTGLVTRIETLKQKGAIK